MHIRICCICECAVCFWKSERKVCSVVQMWICFSLPCGDLTWNTSAQWRFFFFFFMLRQLGLNGLKRCMSHKVKANHAEWIKLRMSRLCNELVCWEMFLQWKWWTPAVTLQITVSLLPGCAWLWKCLGMMDRFLCEKVQLKTPTCDVTQHACNSWCSHWGATIRCCIYRSWKLKCERVMGWSVGTAETSSRTKKTNMVNCT